MLRFYLGIEDEHTVYKAEGVGLVMGLHLPKNLNIKLTHPMLLGADNQAVLRALNNQQSHPGQCILNSIHNAAESLHKKQDGIINRSERDKAIANNDGWAGRSRGVVDQQMHWVPRYIDFAPNEKADEEAKKAAKGDSSDAKSLPKLLHKRLPLSIPALRQSHSNRIKKRWGHRWKSSPREDLLKTINNTTPLKKYLRLITNLDRRQASILFQLRTGHIGLNHHLFQIRKSNTPVCPNCQSITVETVKHYLLVCPFYQRERHELQTKLRHNADLLLSSPVSTKPLLKFVHATGRFKSHFGKNPENKIPTRSRRNAELRKAFNTLEKIISDTAALGRRR